MTKELITKLIADGFTQTDEDQGVIHFSRPSKVGAPVNVATGLKVDIFVTVDTSTNEASIAVEAHNGEAWVVVELNNIEVELFRRRLGSFEKQIMFAYRELVG